MAVAHPRTPNRSIVSRRTNWLVWSTAALDLASIAAAYAIARDFRIGLWHFGPLPHFGAIVLLTIPGWLAVLAAYGLYSRKRVLRPMADMGRLLQGVVLCMAVLVVTVFAFTLEVSRGWIILVWALSSTILVANRLLLEVIVRRLKSAHAVGSRALVVGAGQDARALARVLRRRSDFGYEVVGFVAGMGDMVDGLPVLGAADEIRKLVGECDASAVFVADGGPETLTEIDRALYGTGVVVRAALGVPHLAASRVVVSPIDGIPLVEVDRGEMARSRSAIKRLFDIAASASLILCSLPVLIAVAIAVRVTSGSPILFSQTRVGAGGQPFTIYKFRTMVRDAERIKLELQAANEADGVLFKMRRDPRVTPLGAQLRRFGLDELPQLFNILRGDMSLVGPRPALPEEAELWPDELRDRLNVKPGLTGLWQVSGRHELGFDDYMRYDLFYARNWSLGLDIQIVARTLPALLSRRGAY